MQEMVIPAPAITLSFPSSQDHFVKMATFNDNISPRSNTIFSFMINEIFMHINFLTKLTVLKYNKF